MKNSWFAILLTLTLSVVPSVEAENAWSTEDYDLYAGDFDGDGFSDLLYIARKAGELNGIALFDGAGFNLPLQSWGNAYLGIPWSSGDYRILVADFNGDKKDDLFLQRNSPGDHYLLLAEDGGIGGIYQAVPQDAAGIAWSADEHEALAGDFNGDGRADLFFQPTDGMSLSAVILTDENGQFTSKVPDQSWANGYAGFNWARAESLIFSGDFDANGQDDLLIQAQPLPGTGPGTGRPAEFTSNMNGAVLAQGGKKFFVTEGVQAWSEDGFGADWSPVNSSVVVGDLNGDKHSDVLLQGQTASDQSFLLYGKTPGAIFRNADVMDKDTVPAADQARIFAGRFSPEKADALYLQAISASRDNSLAQVNGTRVDTLLSDASPAVPPGDGGGQPGGGGATAALTVTSAGRTPGQFSVSALGGATYQIPLWTPPGARGIDPSLSLVYMSGGPDGAVGPGWSLAGLSVLARCGKTYASSAGSPQPVKLTTADDICLDGNRLRKTSGTQLVAGSTYQTEIEVFSRVTAYGTAGNGPSYFIAEGKDGLLYEYGNTADSKAYANAGSTPYAWMLNKVRDRQGNNLTVTYLTTSGDIQPTTIKYTQTPATGTTYPYTVSFTYQTRVTPLSKYIAGGNVQQTKVLSKINVQHSSTSIRQYNLTYVTAPTTQRDRLASMQECGGSAGTDCLRATTISYQNGTAGIAAPNTTAVSTTNGYAESVDVNGDGKTDLVYATGSTSSSHWYVQFANANGTYGAAVDTGLITTSAKQTLFGDFYGKGNTDIVGPVSGFWSVARWNGSAFVIASSGTAFDSGSKNALADTDGDGKVDLVSLRTDNKIYVRRNTSSGVTPSMAAATMAFNWGPGLGTNIFSDFHDHTGSGFAGARFIDVNGDGRQDIIAWKFSVDEFGVDTDQYTTLLANGGTFSTSFTYPDGEYLEGIANVNNDQCSDLVFAFNVQVSACNGTQTNSMLITGSPVGALDWDGDGRDDALVVLNGVINVSRSLGNGFATPVSTGITALTSGHYYRSDSNGDGLTDLVSIDDANGSIIKYGLHNGALTPADLATTIADGWGISASPTYVPITQNNYSKYSDAVFPDMDIQGPLYVVSQALQSDGLGSTFTNTFWYFGARFNRQGRGFEGFERTRTRDSRNNLYRYVYYRRDYPYIGRVSQDELYQPNGTSLITETVNNYTAKDLAGAGCTSAISATNRCFPYVYRQTTTTRDLTTGSPLIQTAVTDFVFDNYGNPTSITTTTTDNDATSPSPFVGTSWVSVVANTYTNNTTNWCLGLPTQTTTQNTVPGQVSATRRVDHAVNAANCRFTTETIEPLTALEVATTFGYDSCGNVNSVSVVGKDSAGVALPARVTTSSYGTRCQFAETVTNPLSQATAIAYNYSYGIKASTTDPNNVQVSWLYDNFGRRTRENRPDSTYTTWDYDDCIAATCWGETDLRLLVTETQFNSAAAVVRSREQHFDGLERIRFDAGNRVLGVWTNTQIKYDNLGRKLDVYQPYSSASNGYHHFGYDILNRPTTDTWYAPSGTVDRTTSMSYVGLKTTFTDAKGNDTQKWTDVAGKLRRIVDSSVAPDPAGQTDYLYDSFGNLKQITDPDTKVTSYVYNIRGFKTSATDPDTGSSTFVPNSLNELVSQTDAKGQVISFTYDKLGRMLTRLEPESATATQWTYGTSAALHEIGQLKTVTKPDGYAESYTYDSIGRPASVTYTEDAAYQVNYTYNSIGALDLVTYPTSTSGYRFALKHLYSYGFLQQVKDNASSATYWTLNSANDYSSPLTELLGNAVTTTSGYEPLTNEITSRKVGSGGSTNNLQDLTYRWDDNGNMDRRQDLAQALTEILAYDALNRLETSTLNGGTPLSIDYDVAGNIKNKSDVSATDYDYITSQAGCSYTGLPAQPHAVRNAGGVVYCYDKNGNMIKRGGSNITWYSYNQPNNIASGSNSTQFNYNANYQRWKQVAVDAGATTTTYYVGRLLEKVVRPTGVTEYRHLIPAGSSSAIYARRSDATNSTYYMTSDHLGSGDLVLSSSGTVLARESFSPFGERRGSNWQGPPTAGDKTVFGDVSRRGFTGHEMLDAVGLVNMNGRVYDPRIGRFLSADPVIQTIGLSQALNPYSYVMNNPLTSIDPSGYSWLSRLADGIGKLLKGIARVAMYVIAAVVSYFVPVAGPYIGAAIASGYNYAMTGQLTITFGFGFGGSSTSQGFGAAGVAATGGAAGPLIVTTTTIPTVMTIQQILSDALAGSRVMEFLTKLARNYLQLQSTLQKGERLRSSSTRGAESYTHNEMLLSSSQAEHIFRISRYQHIDELTIGTEARKLATDMYFEALEQDEAMSIIEELFKASLGGWQRSLAEGGKKAVLDTMTEKAKEYFRVGSYASIEARYAATGAGIVNQTAAAYRRRYDELLGL